MSMGEFSFINRSSLYAGLFAADVAAVCLLVFLENIYNLNGAWYYMKSEGNTHVCLIIDTICELRRVYYFCCWCWWFYYFFSLFFLSLSRTHYLCPSFLYSFLCAFYLFLPAIFFAFFSVVLYRCAWWDVNDVCVREGFSLCCQYLKAKCLAILYVPVDINGGRYFFFFFVCFFCVYAHCSLLVMWLRREHIWCQSTIRWVHKRLGVWIAIWWLTSFFSRLIFLLHSGRSFFFALFPVLCNVLVCKAKKKNVERKE